jgi:DNA-binding transcriptional ArsR family regulator
MTIDLAALADPTRQRIIELLAQRELSSGEIADRFEISPPAISQHLNVLKRAQLVRSRVDGQRRIYELDPVGFTELQQWLANVTHFWRGRLNRLEAELQLSGEGTAHTAKGDRRRRPKREPKSHRE